MERIGPAHYGSAPGLRDWPQGAFNCSWSKSRTRSQTKTKHIRVGSTARTVTAVTAAEDINRQELVRPFLLERASTQASSQTDATAINLGAYL
ncbi:MAG: hypothetical protein ACLU7D_10605 [Collinsella sp.]